jgi:L-aminopeptidase/D-esterase-like protein
MPLSASSTSAPIASRSYPVAASTVHNPYFAAAYEAAREAVYNCLVAARPAERLDGTMQDAFPIEAVRRPG